MSIPNSHLKPYERQVLAAIPPQTVVTIADIRGDLARTSAAQALCVLVKTGLVTRLSHGRYALAGYAPTAGALRSWAFDYLRSIAPHGSNAALMAAEYKRQGGEPIKPAVVERDLVALSNDKLIRRAGGFFQYWPSDDPFA